MLHQKRKNVAALATAETLKTLTRRVDGERRRFLLVERTARLEDRPHALQGNTRRNHIDDTRAVFYFFKNSVRDYIGHKLSIITLNDFFGQSEEKTENYELRITNYELEKNPPRGCAANDEVTLE